MDRVGILIVSKCLSSSAIIYTLSRSVAYRPEFYVVERQVNPFNSERAKVHHVIPDLNLREIVRFVARHRNRIDFGLVDTEDFVIQGGRDVVERETGVPMVCVTEKYAMERSKADQRLLFDRIFPDANPSYKIFDPRKYSSEADAVSDFMRTASELGQVVVKPDAPARGTGVGVWGSDFSTKSKMVGFFRNVYSKGRVVVEQRIEGEESSFQAFSDGRHLTVAPLARDYKRALDGGRGSLTGGMGSYRAPGYSLPFLKNSEWERVVEAERAAFRRWKGRGSNPALRGIVLYDALMHTGNGFKVLERNSRGGNTEQINLLTTMKDDFVDVCYRMIDGTLKGIRFSKEASVVTCAVPLSYGTARPGGEANSTVDLGEAYRSQMEYEDRLRIFPMDLRLENGRVYLGGSRSIAVVGLGPSIEEARKVSLSGIDAIAGPVRSRRDIASVADIKKSIYHLKALR